MIRLCRITRSGTDSLIFFVNQRVFGQLAFRLISPGNASPMMQHFRKSFCESVSNRFDHDGTIRIMRGIEFFRVFIRSMNTNDEAADVVNRGGGLHPPSQNFRSTIILKFHNHN